MDEEKGSSSYAIDLSNGGLAYVIGNCLQQGLEAENYMMLSYGAEGQIHSTNELWVVNNTFVNELDEGYFIRVKSNPAIVKIINNIVDGAGELLAHGADEISNLMEKDPQFVDRRAFDYHLQPGSPAIDAGTPPGKSRDFSLSPEAHYIHKMKDQKRVPVRGIDIGAYEYMFVTPPHNR
jgi:hypothetical protein